MVSEPTYIDGRVGARHAGDCRRLWSEWKISLGLITGVSWLTVRSREHKMCGAVVRV